MIHHRGTEGTEKSDVVVSHAIIGAAVEVHRALGPGLLESTYQRCLCHELNLRGIGVDREVAVPIQYKGLTLHEGYRIDLIADGSVIIEAKAITAIEPIHKAQLLTYLKLTNHRVGLLINFNVERLVGWGSPCGKWLLTSVFSVPQWCIVESSRRPNPTACEGMLKAVGARGCGYDPQRAHQGFRGVVFRCSLDLGRLADKQAVGGCASCRRRRMTRRSGRRCTSSTAATC